MYDEIKAIMEIGKLPNDARGHLGHLLRNTMQSIVGVIEEGHAEQVSTFIEYLDIELRRMGI